MKKVKEVLSGKYSNHIFPLFWQHGEEEQVLRDYMDKIYNSGIKSVCVEARPHPDFLGDKWWMDIDAIIDEAKKRDMKVWILDDSHFPTGFANGRIKNEFPHLRKRFLGLKVLDFVGPMKNAEAIIKYALSDKEDEIIGVILGRKLDYENVDPDTLMDITEGVKENKTVSFDLPEGQWSVMILYTSFNGGEKQTEEYLNPIDPEATDILINTVYESHYEKYKEEFGQTIVGFFSDEPRFGNMHGPLGSIGRFDMVLPWRKDMLELMDKRLGISSLVYLPLLFIEGGEKAHQLRYAYMDLVSRLYSENFNQRIGNWCEEHNVMYIGHTIEDNNAHGRLGYGAGHFYRAMAGQHMAGIDEVLHQLMPGQDYCVNKAMTSNGWDGEFFHYALAKLGTSLGHMDPKKKGRIMCEVFGAYGWAEGNKKMKWTVDHMLVRGVNEFVPHAFDPKQYPDFDCPPHFYAHGKNPQFEGFKLLMAYTNRMSHLLSDGIHRAPLAIVYHGEAEWAGEYMLLQKPAAELTRNQIDFDILPIDELVKAESDYDGIKVNKEIFKGLVVPYAEALPKAFLEKILVFAKKQIPIYFLEALPVRESEGNYIESVLDEMKAEKNIHVINLDYLVGDLKKAGLYEISTSSYEPYLRYYHYEQEDGHIFMFVNEHPYNIISTKLKIPFSSAAYTYNAMENTLKEDENALKLNLNPYESKIIIFPNTQLEYECRKEQILTKVEEKAVEGIYKVSFATSKDFNVFEDVITLDSLIQLQELDGKEDFAGIIRYEMNFSFDSKKAKSYLLLRGVSESAKVILNNKEIGMKIVPPYRFDISDDILEGENKLVIDVSTTLVREQYDWLSQYMLLEPIGITESIIIESYE